jgi:hypothetical protein
METRTHNVQRPRTIMEQHEVPVQVPRTIMEPVVTQVPRTVQTMVPQPVTAQIPVRERVIETTHIAPGPTHVPPPVTVNTTNPVPITRGFAQPYSYPAQYGYPGSYAYPGSYGYPGAYPAASSQPPAANQPADDAVSA